VILAPTKPDGGDSGSPRRAAGGRNRKEPFVLVDPTDRDIAEIREIARGAERIVFVSGNFNILHPGHLRLLKFAAEVGDFLVVGVLADDSPNVTVPAEMRLEALRAISFVNAAIRLHCAPEDFIARLQPHFAVMGKEHALHDNPEQAALAAYGGQLLFSSGEARFSSVDLLHNEYSRIAHSTVLKPVDYALRHGFGFPDLTALVGQLAGLRVLVIGDLILDEYISCDPLGMSQEDPTIVVTPIESKTFIGGAGIVAGHAAGLGAEVGFVTLVGQDDRAAFAQDRLAGMGVKMQAVADETRPTPLKQRFRASGQTLLRVNHLRQHAAAPPLVERLVGLVEQQLDRRDLLLFADFNYGCLPQAAVDHIAAAASAHGVMMAADSQASSQLADVSRFRGMRLLTPTEREARLALQDTDSGLVILAEKLQQKTGAENVIVTLGAEGILLHGREGTTHRTDRLPALNTAPKDVAGAGDSLFACTALAVCAGADIWRSAYLGSLAAACQVARVGNTPLTARELIEELSAGAPDRGA
jgi:rfaE bifunctional protein kinase chain/domain